MNGRSVATSATAILICSLWMGATAQAWDQHTFIMQSLGRTTANLNRKYLYDKISIPTLADEKKMIHEISAGLELNEKKVPLYAEKHPDQKEVELYELFRGEMIDEPDQGMDQDLPESADPSHFRKWMGGSTGPTSQGFRHMYFAGFDYRQPLQTLQYPVGAVGQAPARYQKLIALSDKFFREGQKFWGVRTLLWALHYLQDLHQPFHVIQIPFWKYLPFQDLFNGFIGRTSQTIANYHYAYEGVALSYLKHYDDTYFRDCLETAAPKITEDLAEIVAKSKEEGRNISSPLYDLFGASLKAPAVDLTRDDGKTDYYQLLRASQDEGVFKLREATCRLYQSVAQYTWGQFDRAFNYIPETSRKRGR